MRFLFPAAACLLSLALTPLVRYLAIRRGIMAMPKSDRWHKKPTALLGGIAIYLSVAVPLFFLADFGDLRIFLTDEREWFHPLPDIPAVAFLGWTLSFILGLIDDFIGIKPHTKLIGQIMVASLVVFLGFRLHWFTSITIDTLFTMIWVVGITNALNLIDNMDGLCAGVGMIAAVCLALLMGDRQPGAAALGLLTGGALLGFLVYNFKPASIFMGDCGSLPVGFMLAFLGLVYAGSPPANALSTVVVPVMALMVPILDTTLVSLVRILSGRKASTGGRDHTSHRLVLMGFKEKGAVLFLYGVGVMSGITALIVHRQDTLTSPAVIIPMGVALLLMGIYMAQIRVYPEKEFALLLERPYSRLLMDLTYKRQILLVAFDFCLVAFAYYLAYRLRYDSTMFAVKFPIFVRSLPAVIVCKIVAFFYVGVYRGIWRYMSTNDVFVSLKGSVLGTFMALATVTLFFRFQGFSSGVFLTDWLVTTGLLLGTRGSFRLFVDAVKRKSLRGERVIIYGAGRGGEILLREILHNSRLELKPVGFIDDDVLKTGKKLLGYPVFGTFRQLPDLVRRHGATCLLISFTQRSPEQMGEISRVCRETGLTLKAFAVCVEAVDTDP